MQTPHYTDTPSSGGSSRRELALGEIELCSLGWGAAGAPLMRAAYELWRDGWTATLREVSGIERIDSNEFTRQDEIEVIVHRGACIAVTSLRWVDVSLS